MKPWTSEFLFFYCTSPTIGHLEKIAVIVLDFPRPTLPQLNLPPSHPSTPPESIPTSPTPKLPQPTPPYFIPTPAPISTLSHTTLCTTAPANPTQPSSIQTHPTTPSRPHATYPLLHHYTTQPNLVPTPPTPLIPTYPTTTTLIITHPNPTYPTIQHPTTPSPSYQPR